MDLSIENKKCDDVIHARAIWSVSRTLKQLSLSRRLVRIMNLKTALMSLAIYCFIYIAKIIYNSHINNPLTNPFIINMTLTADDPLGGVHR